MRTEEEPVRNQLKVYDGEDDKNEQQEKPKEEEQPSKPVPKTTIQNELEKELTTLRDIKEKLFYVMKTGCKVTISPKNLKISL